MVINNKKDLNNYLKCLKYLGCGSQGEAYYDFKNKKVIKIFHDIFDEDSEYFFDIFESDILKFKDCNNDTYIFADDVVYLNDKIIGYTMSFAPGDTIDKINPLKVNLDLFYNALDSAYFDIKKISDYKILTFDCLYNTMYGNDKISIIDADEYCFSNIDEDSLYQKNRFNFNIGIMLFLVDTYFDEFVKENKILNEMYMSKDIDIREFLIFFRNNLSEYVGKNIVILNDAKLLLNKKKHERKLIRTLN